MNECDSLLLRPSSKHCRGPPTVALEAPLLENALPVGGGPERHNQLWEARKNKHKGQSTVAPSQDLLLLLISLLASAGSPPPNRSQQLPHLAQVSEPRRPTLAEELHQERAADLMPAPKFMAEAWNDVSDCDQSHALACSSQASQREAFQEQTHRGLAPLPSVKLDSCQNRIAQQCCLVKVGVLRVKSSAGRPSKPAEREAFG